MKSLPLDADRASTASRSMRAVDPRTDIISISPSQLKFGVIPSGYYYNLKFSIHNNTLTPVRIKVDVNPAHGEKNIIRIVHLPDLVAPGMGTSITLEIASEHVGISRFSLQVAQNQSSFTINREIEAHVVSQETFKYVKKSLQIQKRPVHAPNVEAQGPMMGMVGSFSTNNMYTFSEAQLMDDEDVDDLLDLPISSNLFWDPFTKCLRLDPQLGGVHVDPYIDLDESVAQTTQLRQRRADELEEQGFITFDAVTRLREDRTANGYVDPYHNVDAFGGFDVEEAEDETSRAEDEEEADTEEDVATAAGSTKSMASVSSLLAMKRERIEIQRRATINASSQFAKESLSKDSSGLAHSMRTLSIVQNKNKTYSIAEDHKVA